METFVKYRFNFQLFTHEHSTSNVSFENLSCFFLFKIEHTKYFSTNYLDHYLHTNIDTSICLNFCCTAINAWLHQKITLLIFFCITILTKNHTIFLIINQIFICFFYIVGTSTKSIHHSRYRQKHQWNAYDFVGDSKITWFESWHASKSTKQSKTIATIHTLCNWIEWLDDDIRIKNKFRFDVIYTHQVFKNQ